MSQSKTTFLRQCNPNRIGLDVLGRIYFSNPFLARLPTPTTTNISIVTHSHPSHSDHFIHEPARTDRFSPVAPIQLLSSVSLAARCCVVTLSASGMCGMSRRRERDGMTCMPPCITRPDATSSGKQNEQGRTNRGGNEKP